MNQVALLVAVLLSMHRPPGAARAPNAPNFGTARCIESHRAEIEQASMDGDAVFGVPPVVLQAAARPIGAVMANGTGARRVRDLFTRDGARASRKRRARRGDTSQGHRWMQLAHSRTPSTSAGRGEAHCFAFALGCASHRTRCIADTWRGCCERLKRLVNELESSRRKTCASGEGFD